MRVHKRFDPHARLLVPDLHHTRQHETAILAREELERRRVSVEGPFEGGLSGGDGVLERDGGGGGCDAARLDEGRADGDNLHA
jgi:hypothetical protein